MQYLIALITLLAGGLYFQTKKRQSAEALLENTETKEEVQKIQAAKDVNNANLTVEEQKRKELNETQPSRPIIDSDILNFFNRKK